MCELVPLHLPSGVTLRNNIPVLVLPTVDFDGLTLAIGASVLAHGITGTPLTRMFGGTLPAGEPEPNERQVD